MALPGTHLRFALDLAPRYTVGDVGQLLSGTVYPDSRWLTGVDRESTHGAACLSADFPRSDFTLGWHLHCLCDTVQQPLHEKLLPDAGADGENARWIRHTAAKVVQDMHDLSRFDLPPLLPALDHVETPLGEDAAGVRRFNALLQTVYAAGAAISLDDYRRLWLAVGLSPAVTGQVMTATRELLEQPGRVRAIRGAYAAMLANALPEPATGG